MPADLSRGEAVDELAETIADRFGSVDILVNNAGRSIRRTALDSVDRFHDYERTMALNYFGPTRLTLRLLPAMLEAKSGHIINVGTWGVTAGVMPRFSAYHASKSALSAFGRSLGAECHGTGVDVTTVQFPLIRTPMIDREATDREEEEGARRRSGDRDGAGRGIGSGRSAYGDRGAALL